MGSTLSFTKIEVKGYEEVVSVSCSESGLQAIIAIHNTTLGPALGGIRALQYESEEEALEDALRLACGMTYKAAIADSSTGGGKSVIILQKGQVLTPKILQAFGRAMNTLKGRYICAEDMGVDCQAIDIIHSVTDYVVGIEKISGDPSRFTSYGVFLAMQAAALGLWGNESFEGKTVAIQGLGAVGMKLAERVFWAGGNLVVADVSQDKANDAVRFFGAKVVSADDILYVDCDILAPCARGGLFHADNLKYLSCKSIVGGANNQLVADDIGELLLEAGILYAPDYLANAGGLINVAQELNSSGYDAKLVWQKTQMIKEKLVEILKRSKENHTSTLKIANDIVKEALNKSYLLQ